MQGTFQIDVGHRGREPVTLDALALVDSRMLIQANSGGGKSWLLRKIAEQTGGRLQTVILDPEGEFATLREKVDFVLVGDGGDVPAHPKMAATLARTLCELGTSAVINLSELERNDRQKFVKLFLGSLMSMPKRLQHPMLILIDEAHMFCPEKGAGESIASDSVISLMTRGRKRGYCGVLVTQRISKLRKDAVSEVNNLCIGRTVLDVDQKRAADALGLFPKDRNALRDLKPGEFWAFGPAFSFSGLERFQVGKVSTSHPKAGARHNVKVPAPRRAIQGALGKLHQAMEGTQDEVVDLDAAKKQIAGLERQLKRAQNGSAKPGAPDPEALQRAVDAAVSQRDAKWRGGIDRCVAKAQKRKGQAQIALSTAQGCVEGMFDDLAVIGPPPPEIKAPAPASRVSAPVRSAPRREAGSTESNDADLGKCALAILRVLAQFPEGRTKSQAAILSDPPYSKKSSGYQKALSTLRTRGLIERGGTDLVITEEGAELIGEVAPPPAGSALAARWYPKVGLCARTILQYLVEAGGAPRSKDEISEATGYSTTSSGFQKALSTLRTVDLISRDAEPCASSLLID